MTILFPKKNDMRCPACLTEWNKVSLQMAGLRGCPKCKTALEPLKIEEDGYIHVNWQDMRMLVLYAKRWSKIFDRKNRVSNDAIMALDNIVAKIQSYRPENGALLIPENDIVIIEKVIRENIQGQPVIELTIKHAKEEEVEQIPSPYFVNIQ